MKECTNEYNEESYSQTVWCRESVLGDMAPAVERCVCCACILFTGDQPETVSESRFQVQQQYMAHFLASKALTRSTWGPRRVLGVLLSPTRKVRSRSAVVPNCCSVSGKACWLSSAKFVESSLVAISNPPESHQSFGKRILVVIPHAPVLCGKQFGRVLNPKTLRPKPLNPKRCGSTGSVPGSPVPPRPREPNLPIPL